MGGFDEITGLLDYPMFVVTTATKYQRAGCLVGFATQASIDPARFLVCISDKNHTYRVAREAPRLAVHVLAADDRALAELFGTETGDDADKFSGCAWRAGPDGVPVLNDARAWFSGRVVERIAFGDHVGFLIEPDAGELGAGEKRLLTFQAVKDLDPGHDA